MTKREAQAALDKVLQRRDLLVTEDSKTSTGAYLAGWIVEQKHRLKLTTWFNYDRYLRLNLVSALGTIPLPQLQISLDSPHPGPARSPTAALGPGNAPWPTSGS